MIKSLNIAKVLLSGIKTTEGEAKDFKIVSRSLTYGNQEQKSIAVKPSDNELYFEQSSAVDFKMVIGDTNQFDIYVITKDGKISPAQSFQYTLTSSITAPTGITLVNKFNLTQATPAYTGTVTDISFHEWILSTADLTAAPDINTIPNIKSEGSGFIIIPNNKDIVQKLWVRRVDTKGNVSAWYPNNTTGIAVTAVTIATGDLATGINTSLGKADAADVDLLNVMLERGTTVTKLNIAKVYFESEEDVYSAVFDTSVPAQVRLTSHVKNENGVTVNTTLAGAISTKSTVDTNKATWDTVTGKATGAQGTKADAADVDLVNVLFVRGTTATKIDLSKLYIITVTGDPPTYAPVFNTATVGEAKLEDLVKDKNGLTLNSQVSKLKSDGNFKGDVYASDGTTPLITGNQLKGFTNYKKVLWTPSSVCNVAVENDNATDLYYHVYLGTTHSSSHQKKLIVSFDKQDGDKYVKLTFGGYYDNGDGVLPEDGNIFYCRLNRASTAGTEVNIAGGVCILDVSAFSTGQQIIDFSVRANSPAVKYYIKFNEMYVTGA